jgi:hypothetical protein
VDAVKATAIISPEFLQGTFGDSVSVAMSDRVPHVTDLAAACYGLMCARAAPSLHDEFRHGVPHCWSVGADAVGSSAGGVLGVLPHWHPSSRYPKWSGGLGGSPGCATRPAALDVFAAGGAGAPN